MSTYASYVTGLSGVSNVSFRFGGKGRVASNQFTTTGFPSEVRKVTHTAVVTCLHVVVCAAP